MNQAKTTNIENWRRNRDQRVESWKNLEENPWMMSILENLGEFQQFWAVLEERKKKGRGLNIQENFQKLTDWTSREYLGLIVILKE